MSCLGVLFSLSASEIDELRALGDDEGRLGHLQEVIEARYFEEFPERMAELDKSWDALHRSLTDGRLEWENGNFPLNHVILTGELLYSGDDYIMSLKSPQQVIEIAAAVQKVTIDDLQKGYLRIDTTDYGLELSEEDFEYTWEWFNLSKEFWRKAAEERRFVLFTADQ